MTDWTTIPDTSLDIDKPGRSIDALALRDNPVAIAERAPGAPRVKPGDFETLTGSGDYTVPDGVTRLRVVMVGGGGGGGGSPVADAVGGGGGGGALVIFNLDVAPGDTIPYAVGAGGAGGAGSSAKGADGAATTFGAGSESAGGGIGGTKGAAGPIDGEGGLGGAPVDAGKGDSGFRGMGVFAGHGFYLGGAGGQGSGGLGAGTDGEAGTIILEY